MSAASAPKLPFNFRQVEGTKNVFRCANPDRLNDESACDLINTWKIQTIMDLRNENEYRLECRGTALSNYFKRSQASTIDKFNLQPVRYLGGMVGIEMQLKIFFSLKFLEKFMYLYYNIRCILFGGYENIGYPCKKLDTFNTLAKQNIFVLENAKSTMKNMFSRFLYKENFPILICCKVGKDRTGLMAAILMKLTGCSDEDVINAYHKSEELLIPVYPLIRKHVVDELQVAEEFAKCPKHVMEQTLQHIETRYGNVVGYLKNIGFTDQEIVTIRNNIQGK